MYGTKGMAYGVYDGTHVSDLEATFKKRYTFVTAVGYDRIAVGQPLGKCITKRGENFAPQIISVSFEDIRAEVLLHALEDRGIYVSSGSACSSNHPGISGTLKAIGLREDLLDSTIRISLSELNNREEADYFLKNLVELLPLLRKFVRK